MGMDGLDRTEPRIQVRYNFGGKINVNITYII